MTYVGPVLVAALLLVASTARVAAYYEVNGVFVPDERCQAYDSIRRQTNPGDVVTIPGQTYNARALNKENGDYVQIDVANAAPQSRWVSLSCGELLLRQTDDRDTERSTEGENGKAFTPFFDDKADGAQDPSPPAPALTPLDTAVLEVCGAWGSRPPAQKFRAMLDQETVAPEVDQIYQALDGTLRDQRLSLSAFKDEFTGIWFKEDGFAHIFCGEPSNSTIGGLHFYARYLQLQQQGLAGISERCNKTEIAPPIYTFGVAFKTPAGRVRTACPKGYALNLDAREIFIAATQGYRSMITRTSGKAMCLEEVAEPGVPSYFAVFVIKNGAIRTFYPDASPTCDGNRPAGTCACKS